MTSRHLPSGTTHIPDKSLEQNASQVEPRMAATLILVRDQPEGYEVFMVKRPNQGAFPNLHVFPGGKIALSDSRMDEYCPALAHNDASRILSVRNDGLRFWIGAIRECFEECGVLFAYKNNALLKIQDELAREQLQHWSLKVASCPDSFRELLDRQELTLATDELHYFSHWITPKVVPDRFDTRFFLAKLPPAQEAAAQGKEVVSSCWIRPEAALDKYTTKTWQLILPTLTTLRMIAHYQNADDLLAQVRAGYHKIPVRPAKQLLGMQPYGNS